MDMEYFKPSADRMAEVVERSLRRWRIRREGGAAAAVHATPRPPPLTIAISREAGTDGPTVARTVGEHLHWQVFDQELVHAIAEQMGLRTQLLESVDEKRASWMQEFLAAFVHLPHVSKTAYVHYLVQTMLALAAHGECVIVERGAAQLLPEETTLRVRLLGPQKDRVAAIRQRLGMSEKEAAQWVEQTDAERRAFVQEHNHKDPADPHNYDVLLHAYRFSAAECAESIVKGLRDLQARSAVRGQGG